MPDLTATGAPGHKDVPLDPRHFFIRVHGEPMPDAKKMSGFKRNLRTGKMQPFTMKQDFRMRTVNGVQRRVDVGCFSHWTKNVQEQVALFMRGTGLKPFPMRHPIKVGMTFFLTRPAGTNLPAPAVAPDWSNYWYAVENALKRTPAKRGIPGRYPDGILYYDDDQILGPIGGVDGGDKRWATPDEPPGVLIEVIDMQPILVERGLTGKTKERVTV